MMPGDSLRAAPLVVVVLALVEFLTAVDLARDLARASAVVCDMVSRNDSVGLAVEAAACATARRRQVGHSASAWWRWADAAFATAAGRAYAHRGCATRSRK